MKIFTTLFLLSLSSLAFAQNAERKITNTCGETYSAGGMGLKISVGEPIVGMLSTTGGSISQGFFHSKPSPVAAPPLTNGYSFYPNPLKDVLQVKGDITKIKQLQLYDATGKIILTQAVTGSTVNIKGLTAGVYTARLIDGNSTIIYYTKLVKL
jgi:hypothetical protein